MCPLCGQVSQHIRSSYTRHVADVPSAGRQVQLVLRVRKFRCDTTDCPRRIFVERLTPFIEPWARMSTRLSQTIEAIGLATSGELGSRFAPRIGIVTSPTTILRRTMTLPAQRSEAVLTFLRILFVFLSYNFSREFPQAAWRAALPKNVAVSFSHITFPCRVCYFVFGKRRRMAVFFSHNLRGTPQTHKPLERQSSTRFQTCSCNTQRGSPFGGGLLRGGCDGK